MLDKVIKQSPEEMWNEFKNILNRHQFYRYTGIWFYPDFKDQLVEIEYTYKGILRDCSRYRKSDDKKECILQAKIDKYVNLLPVLQDQLAIYVELLKNPAMLTPDMLTSLLGDNDNASSSKHEPTEATRMLVNIKSMVWFVKDQRRRLEGLISKIQKLNRKLVKELERLHKS